MRTRIASGVLTALLAIIGIVTVFPFLWMVLSAFKSNSEINAAEQTFLPQSWAKSSSRSNAGFMPLFAAAGSAGWLGSRG